MPVPLQQEKKSEAALVVFTLLVPASVGMAAFSLVEDGLDSAIAALVFAALGMLGSITHLAKPLRAPTSLRNLRSSWLSREIALVSVFWGCLALWLAGEVLPPVWLSFAGRVLSTAVGGVLLVVIAQAYKVPTRPAWCGPECLMELVACCLGAGGAAVALCVGLRCVQGIPVALWGAVAVAAVAGLALDVASHRRRRVRLEDLRAESDERIPLTLARYDELRGKIRWAWALEAAGIVFALVGLWAAALAVQLAAHCLHRVVFYHLPVQVRFVAPLRK